MTCAGDVKAAFLNGIPAPRSLYFSQPKNGIPSLQPGQLAEVLKGVFGLSTSPKLWWMKLSKDIVTIKIDYMGTTITVKQNHIDLAGLRCTGSQRISNLLMLSPRSSR